jgi:hypothetical protein
MAALEKVLNYTAILPLCLFKMALNNERRMQTGIVII